MTKLSHLDEHGAARMVDISGKPESEREARAQSTITLSREAYEAVASGDAPKGDVLAAARLAGIMAAKKTADLIPLCHPLSLTQAKIDFEMVENESAIRVIATTKTTGQTGVEMEALTAASIAALTIYDMVKAVDREARIVDTRLLAKSGGARGDFRSTDKTRQKKQQRGGEARPSVLLDAAAIPTPSKRNAGDGRDAFRAFMTSHRLRVTEWAKEAKIPPSLIYSYLTGKSRLLPSDVVERLARAARVRPEDLFR